MTCMRIALVSPYSWTYPGGVTRHIEALAEELIAAAHAGCFSMALAGILGKAGHPPKTISTQAKVAIEPQGDGFAITRIELTTTADVPGIDDQTYQRCAKEAKDGCPVSKALGGTTIVLVAKLSPAQPG